MGIYIPYSNADEYLQGLINSQKDHIEKLKLEINNNKKQNPIANELLNITTVVFLSKSMPENIILSLLEQGAGQDDIVFAFKGWGNGSIDQMFKYINSLYKKLSPYAQDNNPSIIVHPKAFDIYNINYAPAVLYKDNNQKWYLIQGALSIEASIAQIKKRNFNLLSQQYKVIEPDQIQILKEIAQNHDFNKDKQQAKFAIKKKLQGNLNLPNAQVNEHKTFIPYITIKHNIINPKTAEIIYPAGTRFNILALDKEGQRLVLVINGEEKWQINLAHKMKKENKNIVILYTRLGDLYQQNLNIYPIDQFIAEKLNIKVVPTLIKQNKLQFEVYTIKQD